MTDQYDPAFFAALSRGAERSASPVLELVVDLIRPRSAVDVGCATGAWLRILKGMVDCDYVGVDGDHVPRHMLEIPSATFQTHDLSTPLDLRRRFDLAMSLEVAEHLPAERAAGFVSDLTALAPAVLFSAAVPDQGGVGHVNERWQSYWVELFAAHRFVAWDVIRPALWHEKDVAFCYRQNLLLFVDPDVHANAPRPLQPMYDVVHPDLYRLALDARQLTLGELLGQVPAAVRRSLAHRLGRFRHSPHA